MLTPRMQSTPYGNHTPGHSHIANNAPGSAAGSMSTLSGTPGGSTPRHPAGLSGGGMGGHGGLASRLAVASTTQQHSSSHVPATRCASACIGLI